MYSVFSPMNVSLKKSTLMRNTLKGLSFLVAVFIISTGFTAKNESPVSKTSSTFAKESLELVYTVLNEDEIINEVEEESFSLFLGKSFIGFKEAVGFKESQGRYHIVNEFGYMGKYQFGKSTLELLGVYNTNTFRNDPSLQEKAFEANLSRNKWVLRRDIERFVGKRINGVLVTESGILAAAHLGGPGSVKKFLRSYGADVFADAYGSSVKYYMKKFAGYDTSLVIANKKAKVNS